MDFFFSFLFFSVLISSLCFYFLFAWALYFRVVVFRWNLLAATSNPLCVFSYVHLLLCICCERIVFCVWIGVQKTRTDVRVCACMWQFVCIGLNCELICTAQWRTSYNDNEFVLLLSIAILTMAKPKQGNNFTSCVCAHFTAPNGHSVFCDTRVWHQEWNVNGEKCVLEMLSLLAIEVKLNCRNGDVMCTLHIPTRGQMDNT